LNTRPLSPQESANLACLNRAGKVSEPIFITETGLGKSILDATEPVRRFLRAQGIHDYSEQAQGPENKRLLAGILCADSGPTELEISLYRPNTKQGDPRIWFYGIKAHVAANDICAVFVHGGKLHLLNLSQSQLAAHTRDGIQSPLVRFFDTLVLSASAVSDELLGRLREIASRGPIRAVCSGSTAIGRSLETALDIRINSDRAPDYRGIEIKSGRSTLIGRENRANLFACVPDWTLSRCRSSQAILEEFGYARGGEFKLYCSVSTQAPNSQGLVFELDAAERMLREICKREPVKDVAVWPLRKLESYLAEKHAETFWVKADSISVNGREHFELKSVVHTRDPNIPHLERMLGDGTVTMDHLIKRKPSGGVQEKGPLFKIERARIPELFLGAPRNYALS
jgi:hypothetical protein